MNTCKTCKHWDVFDTPRENTNYACILLSGHNNIDIDGAELWFGYDGDIQPIITEENFGCIHHEKTTDR